MDQCPRCGTKSVAISYFKYRTVNGGASEIIVSRANNRDRHWMVAFCNTCGGGMLSEIATQNTLIILDTVPRARGVPEEIPDRAKHYYRQALNTLHSPDAAIVMAASAVDAMLKDKGYHEGNLYRRIEQATKDRLLTDAMKDWAHRIRLDSNDSRHADLNAGPPSAKDADRTMAFLEALAQYLYVLPSLMPSDNADASLPVPDA